MRSDRSRLTRRRRRGFAWALGAAASLLLMACGDDPNDTPGGGGPTTSRVTSPEPLGPAGSGGRSPEAEDESHPTTPGEIQTATTIDE